MDRRFIWAMVLMMVIIITPTFFMKPPAKRPAARPDTAQVERGRPDTMAATVPGTLSATTETPAAPAETVTVASPLYEYGISTRGGALVSAVMREYKALDPAHRGQLAQLLQPGKPVHQLAFEVGRDTIDLSTWDFVVNGGTALRTLPEGGTETVTLTGTRNGVTVDLAYTFRARDYQMDIAGTVRGIGAVGGHLLVNVGSGFRQTEADSAGNFYEFGVVTKTDESKQLKFSALDPGERRTLSGPFEWAAVKSKYFVVALLALDSTRPRISGVVVHDDSLHAKGAHRAETRVALPVPADGRFEYSLYLGAMEYPRLKVIGHDFYDINPYGWPGFRTLIRPIAVGARWLLVHMHQQFNLAYGLVLVLFGVMIRVVLWPLNQKGMRASLKMQALQPEMQRLQDKYKDDPQTMQREVMMLYKRENVNPFSGCWPVLLPWPILLALFFVFQNTIELRGQAFLWLPDLSLKDPLYIIPVLMGLSMFGLNKVGMSGMPPTPQTKMMLYFLPVMMTVLFVNFASGLNLYYFVQNLVSIPQQFMLAKERKAAQAARESGVTVNTKKKAT